MEEQQDDYRPSIADAIESIIAEDRANRITPAKKPLLDIPQTIGVIGGPDAILKAIPRQGPATEEIPATTPLTGVDVQEEDETVVTAATFLNFKGETIEATADGTGADITVAELVFRVCIGGVAVDVTMPAVPYP